MPGKILIVDDVATNRIVLKAKLGQAFYESIQACDGVSALEVAFRELPDLILLDLMLPDMDGIAVLRQLRANPATRDTPVVIVSASKEASERMRALHAGADAFMQKPVHDQTLMARIRSLMRLRETAEELRQRDATWRDLGFTEDAQGFEAPGSIALIADRPETAVRWRAGLATHLVDQMIVLSREDALAGKLGDLPPDIFVIAADVTGDTGGLRLMSDLRSRANTRHAAVCIVQKATTQEAAAITFDLGANDLIEPDFDPQELALRLRTLLRRKRLADRLRASVRDGLRMAVIDPLTGIYNRRYAIPHLARIAERARQCGQNFAVMIIDIDRFKKVNDTWGHAVGDTVLVEVSRRLGSTLRVTDLLARVGGEEFLVALPDTDLPAAQVAAERLRQVVQECPIPVPGGVGSVCPTVSVGLAMSDGVARNGSDLVAETIARADHALLTAKAHGRNQVTLGLSAA